MNIDIKKVDIHILVREKRTRSILTDFSGGLVVSFFTCAADNLIPVEKSNF